MQRRSWWGIVKAVCTFLGVVGQLLPAKTRGEEGAVKVGDVEFHSSGIGPTGDELTVRAKNTGENEVVVYQTRNIVGRHISEPIFLKPGEDAEVLMPAEFARSGGTDLIVSEVGQVETADGSILRSLSYLMRGLRFSSRTNILTGLNFRWENGRFVVEYQPTRIARFTMEVRMKDPFNLPHSFTFTVELTRPDDSTESSRWKEVYVKFPEGCAIGGEVADVELYLEYEPK